MSLHSLWIAMPRKTYATLSTSPFSRFLNSSIWKSEDVALQRNVFAMAIKVLQLYRSPHFRIGSGLEKKKTERRVIK
jgi:hypothetical protein